MKFETVRKRKKCVRIEIGLFLVGALLISSFAFIKNLYKFEKTYPLVKGTINYTLPDIKVIAMYQQASKGSTSYNEIDSAPTSGFRLNNVKSYCGSYNTSNGGITKDANITLEYASGGGFTIHGLKQDTRCMIYFDYVVKGDGTSNGMLNVFKTLNSGIASSSGATSFTGISTTNEGLKSGTDDDGTTYYFRGAVNNNWVRIKGMYFRIIRINGDGTVRLIYSGTKAPTNSQAVRMTGVGTQIGTSNFNTNSYRNVHIGYMYGSSSASTYADTHKNTYNSTVKSTVDTWYENNSGIFSYLIDENAGFCGDRKVVTGTFWNTSYTGNGTGTATTAYAPYSRFLSSGESYLTTQKPVFTCNQTNDLYTLKSSNKGNKALNYPVGLITADEVAFAGGFGGLQNTKFYLNTSQNYWTMTPGSVTNYVRIFLVGSVGWPDSGYSAADSAGVRPVINLKANLSWTGQGTYNNPFLPDL